MVGECDINDDEFWKMSPATSHVKIQGRQINNGYRSSDIRQLYALYVNSHRKKGSPAKLPSNLWPLIIDDIFKGAGELTEEQLLIRQKIRSQWEN